MLEDVYRSIARQWRVMVVVALVIAAAATALGSYGPTGTRRRRPSPWRRPPPPTRSPPT